MEKLFEKSVMDLSRLVRFSDASMELLERVDKASEELLLPEVEHYIARKFNEQTPLLLQKHNLLGMPVAEEYGGLGADALTYTLAMERLGQLGMGVITFMDVHISLGQLTLQQWGTTDQKSRYLEPATSGKKILAYALTEPEAGSDPASLKTTYELKDGHYVLNGEKYLISNGSIANALIVFARSKSSGISAFIVDSDSEGFSVSMRLEEKLGLFTSDTAMLEFRDCKVPKENMLGREGKGMAVAYSALVNGRYAIAAGCVGVLEDCLNAVTERARQRVQHGKEIGKHQLIQRHIAEIAINLEMARWPTYIAALKKMEHDRKPDDIELRGEVDSYSALAKRIASKLAFEGADRAVQIFGGFGYSILSSVGRHFLDSRVCRIYEGTDEVLDLKIASSILGKEFEAYR